MSIIRYSTNMKRKTLNLLGAAFVVVVCMLPATAGERAPFKSQSSGILPGTLTASNEQELQVSDGHPGCTLATLQGRYLFAESGVLLPPAFGVAAPTEAADAGIHIFNGDGTGTDTVTFRVGGNIVLKNVVSQILYTVNADCTGTITVPNGPSFDIFVAPDGAEFARIATAPAGNYPATIDRRESRK